MKRSDELAIKVFIDQAHNFPGFHDTGCEGFGMVEGEITFGVGICLAAIFNADPRFEVRLSRPNQESVIGVDNFSSIAERVNMANAWPADYFLILDCNDSCYPEENGSTVYVLKEFTRASWMGQNILNGIVDSVGTKPNGVRADPYNYSLRNAKMDTNLIKLGYITNKADAQKLRDEQPKFAAGIYIGFLRFLGYA